MSFLNQIGGLLNQYLSGSGATNREEAHGHYDQIAQAVPGDILGSVIGPALGSLGAQQVQERIQNSAAEMNPEQRAGFLQTLLGGYRSSGVDLSSLLSQLGIRSSVADNPSQASPQDVAKLAAHAHQTNPDIFNRAMSFYGDHPRLVKVLGAVAITAIAKKLADRYFVK